MQVFQKYFLTLILFSCSLPLLANAQLLPTAPAGFDQGPYITLDNREPQKGEKIIRITLKAERKAEKKFYKKFGRLPSKRQKLKQIARFFGLRLATEITSDNVVKAIGVRDNTKKIQKALRKGFAELVEENYRVFKYSYEDIAEDFFCIFGACWGIENVPNTPLSFGVEDIDVDAPGAWPVTQGEGVVVGVIDTGVFYDHPDLADNIFENPLEVEDGRDDDGNGYVDDVRGWNFVSATNDPNDDNFHGTHVSGIIAAVKGNNRGVVGVAPKAKILPLKILGADGSGDTAALIAAIDYATELRKKGVNIRVLNASLGGGESTVLVKQALKRANDAGILFVAAAGNNNENNDEIPVFPANYSLELPNVLSVASIDSTGEVSSFSNYGQSSVHLAAPGGNVWSTIILGWYLPASGTSMAAPHAAGVAALTAARFPQMGPSKIRDKLLNSVKPLEVLEGKVVSPGIVSAALAVQ